MSDQIVKGYWVCDYCNSLNNYADDFCTSCGSPKGEASKEYGMSSRKKELRNDPDKEKVSGIV